MPSALLRRSQALPPPAQHLALAGGAERVLAAVEGEVRDGGADGQHGEQGTTEKPAALPAARRRPAPGLPDGLGDGDRRAGHG